MDYLNDILQQISSLKGLSLVAAACFAVGYTIRLIPIIPNKWIPAFVLTSGPLIAGFLISPGTVAPDLVHPIVGIATQGLLVAVIVHYLHEKVISHLEHWVSSKLGKSVPLLMTGFLFTGCASFSTTQTDVSYDPETNQTRKITTRAKARTLFEAKSALSNFKASQTDKTQGASVGSLNQEASSTNVAANASALAELIRALK